MASYWSPCAKVARASVRRAESAPWGGVAREAAEVTVHGLEACLWESAYVVGANVMPAAHASARSGRPKNRRAASRDRLAGSRRRLPRRPPAPRGSSAARSHPPAPRATHNESAAPRQLPRSQDPDAATSAAKVAVALRAATRPRVRALSDDKQANAPRTQTGRGNVAYGRPAVRGRDPPASQPKPAAGADAAAHAPRSRVSRERASRCALAPAAHRHGAVGHTHTHTCASLASRRRSHRLPLAPTLPRASGACGAVAALRHSGFEHLPALGSRGSLPCCHACASCFALRLRHCTSGLSPVKRLRLRLRWLARGALRAARRLLGGCLGSAARRAAIEDHQPCVQSEA